MSSEPEDPADSAPAPGAGPSGTPRPELTPRALPRDSDEPWRAYLDLTHMRMPERLLISAKALSSSALLS